MQSKILIVGNQGTAMRNFRGSLIAALVDRGAEVTALAPDYSKEDRDAIIALGATPSDLKIRRASISPLYDLATLLHLLSIFLTRRPDIVLCFATKPVIFGTIAAAIAMVKTRYALIEGLGHTFIESGGTVHRKAWVQPVVRLLYKIAFSLATKVLFLNRDDLEQLSRVGFGVRQKSVLVGGVGVDLTAWKEAPPVLAPITFAFIGRLLREKGLVEFVEAARLVKATSPDVRFVVVGAPDSNPSSLSVDEVSAWVDEGLIEWPGYGDVKPHLANASVFVLPSYREGVPRSTQEALAMGRAVVTTDVPGCRETVIEGHNGFLVPPRDSIALSQAMRRFIDDPGLISLMGARSRRLAEERFDVRQATARYLRAMGMDEGDDYPNRAKKSE